MLVLSRKLNERIRFTVDGQTVFVGVSELQRGRVKLSIEAPPEVRIVREEVALKEVRR